MDDYILDDIRKVVIEKAKFEKVQEQEIKLKLENIHDWYDIETKIIYEAQKILKEKLNELKNKKSTKIREIHSEYGAIKINNIQKNIIFVYKIF